ncbi:hydrolase [Toxoplasma gondii GT1]|uniref:Hydrolase n=6 Tax=Toxoplasma gondii TaxID=5811 RepID=S7WE79_TOXGG|nr:hydrolase [Toxoplasma gondii GT1]KAF4641111.1 hydrolase [Toxoplasma gondii]KFG52752.1 hydrolase [Toxoplasma gondii FOU]PUA89723.1 hydrolase [Toxoplasma gondii TgCATBr9]RQX71396.1 hydrolase [Toxoplasma gondii CAST]
MGISSSNLGDAILFPAPASSYATQLPGLLWIEEDFKPKVPRGSLSAEAVAEQEAAHRQERAKQRLFPAFFIEAPGGESQCTILYWHGNSCDLGQIYEEMDVLSKFLNAHVLAIEFPGYGLAPPLNGPGPEDLAAAAIRAESSGEAAPRRTTSGLAKNQMGELINKWSRSAFNFLIWLGVAPASVICFGRSIGTGPASYLAAALAEENIHVGGVVLHAPYITVHKIVQEYASLGTWLISNHWSNAANLEKMGAASCPLLIVHGLDDEVIPTNHGRRLFEAYKSEKKEGFFPADSSHNSYYIIDDLGKPMETFLQDKSLAANAPAVRVSIPAYVREAPVWQLQTLEASGASPAAEAASATSAASAALSSLPSSPVSPERLAEAKEALEDSQSPATEAVVEASRGGPAVVAATTHAVDRSNSALGNLIATATGSKGGQRDVALTHGQRERDENAQKDSEDGLAATRRFSHILESGLFSKGSLDEIRGEALREVTRDGTENAHTS